MEEGSERRSPLMAEDSESISLATEDSESISLVTEDSGSAPLIAEDSESTSPVTEDSESAPLIAEDSSNKISEQSELGVQKYGSSITETNKGDAGTGEVAAGTGEVAAVGSDVDIGKAGCSADGDDRQKLEVEEIKIELGEASQDPPKIKLPSNPLQEAGDVARSAACTSRAAASSCRVIVDATRDAINVGRSRVDKARQKAEEVAEFDEANCYRALASKYDYATRLATRRARQIEAAAESLENAAMEAENYAKETAEISDEASIEAEEKITNAYRAANRANAAVIVASKMEYAAVKAMKKCWLDLDHQNVEAAGYPRRPNQEPRCGGTRQDKVLTWFCNIASFIFGIIIVTAVLSYVKGVDNPNTRISLVTVGSILIALPVLHLFYRIFMCYRNKRREAKQIENRAIIESIDKRLRELENYFESNNISPVQSEFEDE